MKRVYLLGAGASHELCFRHSRLDVSQPHEHRDFDLKGPLSNGFFYYSHQLFSTMQSFTPLVSIPTVGSALISFIRTWYRKRYGRSIETEEIWLNRDKSLKVNIETLYMDIENALSRDFTSSVGAAYILLRDYIFGALAGMCYYCLSRYHQELAHRIVSCPGDHVISFNWDILLDEAMYRTGKWSYRDGYGLAFTGVRYADGESEEEKKNVQNITSSNMVIKPHGSINWYRKEDGDDRIFLGLQLQDIMLRGGTDMMQRSAISIGNEFYSTGIIPPGRKRKGYEPIWNLIKAVLEQGDEVVAIGFSFNHNDEHVREYFTDVQYKQPLKIVVVNPDKEVRSVYQDIFRTERIKQYDNVRDFLGND